MTVDESRNVLLDAEKSYVNDEVVAYELGQIAASISLVVRNHTNGEYNTAKYLADSMTKRAQSLMLRREFSQKLKDALRVVATFGAQVLALPDAGSTTIGPYASRYRPGSRVQIAPLAELKEFMSSYKLHHALAPEQLRYAGEATTVRAVGYYHGGDPVYTLEGAGDFGWLEPCLRDANPS